MIDMFIGLTPYDRQNKTKYYNTDYIKSFERTEDKTILELTYGTDLVTEKPSEIMKMIKGEQNVRNFN